MIGHRTNPADLPEGSFGVTPSLAFCTTNGAWEAESEKHGVPPEVKMDYELQAVCAGGDSQLEKAADVVSDLVGLLKRNSGAQLQFAPRSHGHGDGAELGFVDVAVRRAQVDFVQRVEGF